MDDAAARMDDARTWPSGAGARLNGAEQGRMVQGQAKKELSVCGAFGLCVCVISTPRGAWSLPPRGVGAQGEHEAVGRPRHAGAGCSVSELHGCTGVCDSHGEAWPCRCVPGSHTALACVRSPGCVCVCVHACASHCGAGVRVCAGV